MSEEMERHMGNDNKMKQLTKRSKFLPDEIRDLDTSSKVYSLETEFAKTKKNKNFKLYIFIILFVSFVIGGTLYYTNRISNNTKKYKVRINEFEDVRLKEVLDSAKNAETVLNLKLIELAVLHIKLKDEVLRIQKEHFAREMSVLSTDLSAEAVDIQIKKIRMDEKRLVDDAKSKIGKEIANKNQEIYIVRKELEKTNKQSSKSNDELDPSIANEKKLYSMKMKELKKNQDKGIYVLRTYYDKYLKFIEQKYNPTFKPGKISSVIKTNATNNNPLNVKEYNQLLAKEGIFTPEEFKALKDRLHTYSMVNNRLLALGYKNSIPSALIALRNITQAVVNSQEDLWTKSLQLVIKKNEQIQKKDNAIKRYKKIMYQLFEDSTADGYITDAMDLYNIQVYIKKKYTNPDKMVAQVYRNKTFLGKIRIARAENGSIRASVINYFPKNKMQAYDQIKFAKDNKK